MRLLGSVLAFGAALISAGQAASLAELAAQLPACGLSCLGTAISASPCTPANSTCICTDTALLTSAAACLATSCTPRQQLEVAKIQEEGCGVRVVSQQTKLKIIAHIFCILAEACIIVRIWSKLQLLHKLYTDDWVIILSGAAVIPFWYLLIAIIDLGLGLNMWDTNLDDLDQFFKLFWAEEIVYLNMLAITKVALLLFLLNIFPSQSFRAVCWTVGALTVGIALSFTMATIFSCSPIPHFWTRWQGAVSVGTCNNLNLQTYIAAAINIVQDFTILCLPLPQLYKLQVSTKRKIQLFLMFSVGLFVSIISIIRLKTLVTYGKDYVNLVIWSIIEPTVAIVCACMPGIRQLLGHFASNSFFGSTVKTNPSSGTSGSSATRVYQRRSFKIESKLRSQNDDFHELTSMTDGTGSDAHLDHTSGKPNSLTKQGSQHGTLDGHRDEQIHAAHAWVKHQSILNSIAS
ncbi:related to integral membrane protein [Phialocephala subalpina]|uniref:Related to integral membrane protein n=1 Tax=Phialocephala subalpina TaxID=576137 RepID=A0A1L7WJ19_9HELO|nr:related to integral membrane protein [Phialocephala subalpina]